MGKVGRSDAGEPMTGTDRRHSASPPRSSPPRRHPLPVCAVPRRRPLPQCSATALPRRHPPSMRAVGKLPCLSFLPQLEFWASSATGTLLQI